MTYEEFITELWKLVSACPKSWRKGQKVFNVIDENWGVARYVQMVDGVDCFYTNDDDEIQNFINHAWVRLCDQMNQA